MGKLEKDGSEIKAGMKPVLRRNDGISRLTIDWHIPSLRCAPFRLLLRYAEADRFLPSKFYYTPLCRRVTFFFAKSWDCAIIQ